VVDEFGAVQGMVTTKDLLSAIAGEFPEAYERKEPNDQSGENNTDSSDSLLVDGSHEYAELAPQLGLPPPEEDADYHTVAGLMMEELKTLPEVGDTLDYHGWRFTVAAKAGQRIEQICISRLPE